MVSKSYSLQFQLICFFYIREGPPQLGSKLGNHFDEEAKNLLPHPELFHVLLFYKKRNKKTSIEAKICIHISFHVVLIWEGVIRTIFSLKYVLFGSLKQIFYFFF